MGLNAVKQKLAQGDGVIGIFVGTSDPRHIEICGYAGFDYVLIDAEHSPFSTRDIEHLVRAAEGADIPAFVRVPANRPEIILRILDVGAWGVMIPQVRNGEEAAAAVAAVKYAPEGSRGAAVPRGSGFGSQKNFADWTVHSNAQTMVIVQIENREAVDNLDEILEVPGIDAFELGQADLSQSLGLPGATTHPLVREYVDRAVSKIITAGRALGDTTNDPSQAAEKLSEGYRMVACSLNGILLAAGARYVAEVRASLKQTTS